jgi:YHS domain-containing protein
MKTKRGIYLDIKESDYSITLEGMTFYFSSMFYLNNFKDEIENEISVFNVRINNVYKNKFDLQMNKLALIRLYELIEKRGFRVNIQGVEVDCLSQVQFVSEIKIGNLSHN